MKLFRLIGTMTIVAAVAATMAVSASAEVTATYENDAIKVTAPAATAETGYTVLVSSALNNAEPTEEQIYQLYQDADLTEAIDLPADLPAGKYYVRVGGIEGGYDTASFVNALEVAATGAMSEANTEDDKVAYYYAVSEVPTGLLPYWTNGANTIAAKTDWASFEGKIKLGLTVEKADAVDAAMKLIWE